MNFIFQADQPYKSKYESRKYHHIQNQTGNKLLRDLLSPIRTDIITKNQALKKKQTNT